MSITNTSMNVFKQETIAEAVAKAGGGGSDVTSVNTQTGDVVLAGGDLLVGGSGTYAASSVTAAIEAMDARLVALENVKIRKSKDDLKTE